MTWKSSTLRASDTQFWSQIIKKCRDFQGRSSRGCLYGLLMLPNGILIQRRILEEIKTGVKQMRHPHHDRPLTWADIHDDNFLVKAHKDGDPDVEDLCNCPWED